MKFTAIALLLALFGGLCYGIKKQEHIERGHDEHHGGVEEKKPFTMDERTKEILVKEKGKTNIFIEKAIEFFVSNSNREFERQCFEKFNPDQSVDFVIDLAPSPSKDEVDKWVSESPMALYFDVMVGGGQYPQQRSASRSYFDSVSRFIEKVTYDMKPENTYSIIYNNGEKYYLRGKQVEESVTKSLGSEGGDFSDGPRNLKTMWPVPSESITESPLHTILKNNLGQMTKLALWNRNNGVPTVLGASRNCKPVYSIVITDGSSGAKIRDLVDDLSRTTVIDIGNRRFVKNLEWKDLRTLVSAVTLNAPQQLGVMADTCRNLACRLCGC